MPKSHGEAIVDGQEVLYEQLISLILRSKSLNYLQLDCPLHPAYVRKWAEEAVNSSGLAISSTAVRFLLLTPRRSGSWNTKYQRRPIRYVIHFHSSPWQSSSASKPLVMILERNLFTCQIDEYCRIPETEYPHTVLAKRGAPAENVTVITALEIDCLDILTELGCTSTPRLIDYEQKIQDDDMWLPGGYIVYILIELLPKISLDDFWELPRHERDEVRKAFHTALE